MFHETKVTEVKVYKLTADITRRQLKIKDEQGQIQIFTNFTQDPLYGAFALPVIDFTYKTDLKANECRILEYDYLPAKGGFRNFEENGVRILPNGFLAIACHLSPGSNLMEGELRITFERIKKVCVANCQ